MWVFLALFLCPVVLCTCHGCLEFLGDNVCTSSSSLVFDRLLSKGFFFFNFFFYVYLILRDWDRTHVGEGQRERETENLKQAPGSELSAQRPTPGSNPRTMRSWPEPKLAAYSTEPSRRPYVDFWMLNQCCILGIKKFGQDVLSFMHGFGFDLLIFAVIFHNYLFLYLFF